MQAMTQMKCQCCPGSQVACLPAHLRDLVGGGRSTLWGQCGFQGEDGPHVDALQEMVQDGNITLQQNRSTVSLEQPR